MKRPKQRQHFSFLRFFGRKAQAEARAEDAGAADGREEIAITLTPSEGTEQERGDAEGGEAVAAGGEEEEGPEQSNGEGDGSSMRVLSSSTSSQEQPLDCLECPLCLLVQPRGRFPRLSACPHRCCLDCLRQYLRVEISESRVRVACPQCPELLAPPDIHAILDDPALLERFQDYQLRRFLAADPDTRWCPAPDCSYAVIAYGCAECPRLRCGREGCDTEFCYHCRQLWHPDQTCDQARRQRSRHASSNNDASTLFVFNEEPCGDVEEIKACPRCGAYIMKTNDGSCNRMNCSVCACQFCWLCMQEITDVHYLSPSGCTFWGKKPWSQTRKVVWQVGMLLGAPVVISLIAGIAIPVIIIGIPIYMGRKVHSRCKKNNISGSKHYLTVASGVMMSVFVSPVIAAVTLGVGVPLMMTYVYGVVPMSLCRNGWCRNQKEQAEPHKIQPEDLLNFGEHWTGQASQAARDASGRVLDLLPSTSSSPPDLEGGGERDGSTCTVAMETDMSHETGNTSLREGTNIEVQVEIETHPHAAGFNSISSSRSPSAESLACSREQLCVGGPAIHECLSGPEAD
ncbi:E3 ubiquitin-protein ligase RNF19A isoform X1 [Paramormyrops kingsleyae]|uniref:RBR-type E3 ubiquitin transferase n=2 Tax=Paramormyrops kingsleyae TaxID=1676925 RepID=A0A3B3RMZ8_9TELE|nr:E3 ubiquitin-protein ligase RNF19B-like isoform X1 [Paramormyrops kingsleyae]XP_023655039.1 E3 ubiquitin-protein ligase RNF19B-like isoform X1 [Paramormyrops kingsleyae]